MKIKGKSRKVLFAIMFLGDWFGDKKISELSPEEVTEAFGLVYEDKKIDLA